MQKQGITTANIPVNSGNIYIIKSDIFVCFSRAPTLFTINLQNNFKKSPQKTNKSLIFSKKYDIIVNI